MNREGVKRAALWSAVLAFFWITALKSPLATRAIRATHAGEANEVTVDSVATTSAAPLALSETPPVDIEAALTDWTSRLESIDTSDIEGMRAFRTDFSLWVRTHQNNLGPEMHRWVSEVNDRPLRASFFIAAGILSDSPHPEAFLAELLQAEETPPAPGAELENPEDERLSRNSVVTVFALSEFQARLRSESADYRQSLQPELLARLVQAAETSPDLSIVRESVKTLLLVTDVPERYLTEIRESRRPGELFAIEDLFSGV